MVECARLESEYTARYHEFESHTLRLRSPKRATAGQSPQVDREGEILKFFLFVVVVIEV